MITMECSKGQRGGADELVQLHRNQDLLSKLTCGLPVACLQYWSWEDI